MFRKRWVRRTAFGVLLLAVGWFGFIAYSRYSTRKEGERRLAAIVAQLDSTEPRWRWADLDADRFVPPDDENAALLITTFRAALAQSSIEFKRTDGDYVSWVGRPNRKLDDEDNSAIARAMAGNNSALAVARSFVKYKRAHFHVKLAPNIFDTSAADLRSVRDVFTLLEAEAERHCQNDRSGTALQLVRTILVAARSMDNEPFLVTSMTRVAGDTIAVRCTERILALSSTPVGLDVTQAALQEQADSERLWTNFAGERAAMNEQFTAICTGRISFMLILKSREGQTVPAPPPLTTMEMLDEYSYLPFLPGEHAQTLELMTRRLSLRALPDHLQRSARHAIPTPELERGSVLTQSWTRDFDKHHDASLRAKAQLRCATVGIAVERFRQRFGHWPVTLSEIPADILTAVPVDPFDGKPLRYVARADGVTVYSIGLDETDNGGTEPEKGRLNEDGKDLVFRLYDPKHRGLPPLPREPKDRDVELDEANKRPPFPRVIDER